MKLEIKVPSVGESVKEAVLAQWFKQDGEQVQKDEVLFVLETDKVTLEVVAEADGVLAIAVKEGETVAIGAVVGTIDTAAASAPAAEKPSPPEAKAPAEAPPAADQAAAKAAAPPPQEKTGSPEAAAPDTLPPSVRRLVAEKKVDITQVSGTGPGGRITKGDVLLFLEAAEAAPPSAAPPAAAADRGEAAQPAAEGALTRRKPMSPIRQRIAARLLEAKQNTAMLTTFNEIDMSRAMALRTRYKDDFQKKFGVGLGFMSFFVKAAVDALKAHPEINAYIDGRDILYHDYCHLGIAVGSERGLVVPVIRHVERLGFAEIEQAIVDYVVKIRENRLELADLEGGTFTISNGGVYGSLLSTPILNTPQSGILGMHKIEKRPVVVDDQIVIRPMMYVALSYDHRVVDGKGAVGCLKRIKECLESPERIMMEI
jgi:2-oxoglutarate dehydrogenase E2 component (dihydrolipoamide succinyltransferase)